MIPLNIFFLLAFLPKTPLRSQNLTKISLKTQNQEPHQKNHKKTKPNKSIQWDKKKPKNLSKCSEDGLKNKDCQIHAFNYNISFSAKKISLNDGKWRSLTDMPKHGKEVDWQAIRLFKKDQRLFLEFFLWAIKEYGKVQSLFWDIYEIKGVKMKRVLSEVVQKRRKNITKWKVSDYIYDAGEKHGLKLLKNGKIEWFVKNKKGTF